MGMVFLEVIVKYLLMVHLDQLLLRKLPDENHVLLRVPRENNMYNIDLKNVVPSGDLTCLFAKATLDESMNKLVIGLVLNNAARPVSTDGNLQQALKDKGVIDSGYSRHMTGNISYLSNFEEFNGGYVAFGRNPKGGKILGKGKIKTGKLDFVDVYFVNELKFNLFSLPDENHVLLRVPRENNMYNIDLKNVVPSGDLTCLFEKATLDESMNKLVI
nr:hypothetical protein [Tanacetum cinerariifolium]